MSDSSYESMMLNAQHERNQLRAALAAARADADELVALLKVIRLRCDLKMKDHFSFGPQRYYDKMDRLIAAADVAAAEKETK